MEGYGIETYGDRVAERYDEWHQLDAIAAVELLAGLAGPGGRALELGIGTGRVALPLAQRGIDVHGIDASQAMVARLRAKPGGADIPVTMGNFADVPVDGTFGLIYVPFTTFFALLTQHEQIRCLRNVAAHLEPDGWFVLDAFVPNMTRFNQNSAVVAQHAGADAVRIDVGRHDPVNQRVDSTHVELTERGIRLYPVALRYAWPAELDAMALVAGLQRTERYGGYDRRPFDASSGVHVSVYQPGQAR